MSQNDSLFIYDVYGGVLIDAFSNDNVQTIQSSSVSEKTINFVALNNRIKNTYESRNKIITSLDSSHLFKIKDKWIYVLDGEQDFKRLKSNLELDILVISKSKVSSPEYVLRKLNPKIVILDKNVPPWIIKKWETYSGNHLFKLHNIKKDGAYSASESLIDTAIRETEEEIGIQPSQLTILGSLSEIYIPPSNFVVKPFVAVLENEFVFRPNPAEVQAVLEVPLYEFFRNPFSPAPKFIFPT